MLKNKLFDALTLLYNERAIWEEEVITRYPDFSALPESYLEAVSRLSESELNAFEMQDNFAVVELPALVQVLELARYGFEVPRWQGETSKLPVTAYQHMTAKKQHEVSVIFDLLSRVSESRRITSAVDLCGGAGYLARTLAHYMLIPTTTIDNDQALQERGQAQKRTFLPETHAALNYISADIYSLAHAKLPELSSQPLLIGLHTCGDLAHEQLRLSVAHQIPITLNVGCCYYKSLPENYIISAAGLSHPLKSFSVPALSLASRSHQDTPASHKLSRRVRQFRYLFHLLLYHEYGVKNFISLGNSPRTLYEGCFEDYVAVQIDRLKLTSPNITSLSASSLSRFQTAPTVQRDLELMLRLNILRAKFGRVIERAIILDRAVYLEENGYSVNLHTLFEESVSPRNIGLLGLLN